MALNKQVVALVKKWQKSGASQQEAFDWTSSRNNWEKAFPLFIYLPPDFSLAQEGRAISGMNECRRPMRESTVAQIVVIPDSFKGTASSSEIATAIRNGWLQIRPADHVQTIEFADGGEGTLAALEARISTAIRVNVDGLTPNAYWLLLDGSIAVVELAMESGISLLSELDPMGAHTFNFGAALRSAIMDSRVSEILCAIGGSASTDGGSGALRALGYRFLNANQEEIALGGGALGGLASVDSSHAIELNGKKISILADVDVPLLGAAGAAAIFAPQKGASQKEVELLEAGLQNFSAVLGHEDFAGAGAAGGTAYGLVALLGAEIKKGAVEIAHLLDIDQAIADADLVITGEGRFDRQSTMGKAVGLILNRARHFHKEVLVIAGDVADGADSSVAAISLSALAGSQNTAMSATQEWAKKAGAVATQQYRE